MREQSVILKAFIPAISAIFTPLVFADPTSDDIQQLEALNQQYLESYGSGGVAFFSDLMADEFRETAADGTILNKEQFLNKISANAGRNSNATSIHAEELEIQVFGNTAIVRAIPVITQADGTQIRGGRYTDSYAKLNEEWICVAAHLGGT